MRNDDELRAASLDELTFEACGESAIVVGVLASEVEVMIGSLLAKQQTPCAQYRKELATSYIEQELQLDVAYSFHGILQG